MRRHRQSSSPPICFWRSSLRYTNTMSVYGYSFRLLRIAVCIVVAAPAFFPLLAAVRRASRSCRVTLTGGAGDGETQGRMRAADSCDGETQGGMRAADCRAPLRCALSTRNEICGRNRHHHDAAARCRLPSSEPRTVVWRRQPGELVRHPGNRVAGTPHGSEGMTNARQVNQRHPAAGSAEALHIGLCDAWRNDRIFAALGNEDRDGRWQRCR